jgi:hypothetical protein
MWQMDADSLEWFRTHLEVRYLKARREQFQQLVCDILERRYPGDFKRIRQGTAKGGGDGGCDGFRSSTGTAYAVYAPRETSSAVLKTKIEGDLQKAKGSLGEHLKEWVFVHNDADGLNSDVVLTTLLDLKVANPAVKVGQHMAFQELWDLVRELTFDAACDILPRPSVPSGTNVKLPFDRLRPVLEHLQQATPQEVPLDPVSPEKLQYNQLPVLWADFLQRGRRLSAVVDGYFRTHHDPELGDRIASGFRSRYKSLREQGLSPGRICTELFEFAGGYDPAFRDVESQAAVAAILAYFFDRCDIFENAPA